MSSQAYVFPPFPSPQVKAVQDYLKYVTEFDFESLCGLITDNFTVMASPMNMRVPDKTMDEEFAFLKALQAKLDGKPFVITVYDVNDGEKKTWVHAKLEPLDLEMVYCFQFGEGLDTYKVASVRDVFDSKRYMELMSTAPPSSA